MIECIGVEKSFGSLKVLHNINMMVQEGEIFGIIGKSGAGKSTLLRMMNLLERPDSGEVIVDNSVISQAKPAALRAARHKISMIFQHFNLLSSQSVYDNIVLPLQIQKKSLDDLDARVDALLQLVGLSDKKYAYPAALSGGEKQRVAIARALITEPKVLLCDEATSALDPHTTEAILALLRRVNNLFGITIVLITHDMSVVKQICHRVAVMDKGHLIEVDALAGIVENKASYARRMLLAHLMPELPACLRSQITEQANERPLLRLVFQGGSATVPFISQTSRILDIDINILLANMDRFDGVACGVLVVELRATQKQLQDFQARCQASDLTVEILGYVVDTGN